MPDLTRLSESMASVIGEWETPFVELALFGSGDPEQIATIINAFCQHYLAAAIDELLFYESSQGAVFGLLLDNGERVVVKAHQQGRSLEFLRNIFLVQRHLAQHAYPCPLPLLGPTPLANGLATVETLIDAGSYTDAHRPAVRCAMAELLYRLVDLTRSFTSLPGWWPGMLNTLVADKLWPTPHSRIFDFEATAAKSAWIDRYAARAKQLMLENTSGSDVIGHTDWSVKHFRFINERVSVIYDWDSLALDKEPIIVGDAARGFTMTWHLDVPLAPTPDEARAFVTEYEAARGATFTKVERALLAAAAAYAIAYSARCENCLSDDTEYPLGSYRELLAHHGETILRL